MLFQTHWMNSFLHIKLVTKLVDREKKTRKVKEAGAFSN